MTFSLTVTGACEVPLTIDWGVLDSLAHGADLVPDTAALSPKVRGQGVRLATELPAGELVRRLADDAAATIARLAKAAGR